MADDANNNSEAESTTYSTGFFSGLFSGFSKRSIIIGSSVAVLVLLAIAGIIYFYGIANDNSGDESEILARVNNEEITRKKVNEIQDSYITSGTENFSEEDALEQAVNIKLLYQKAQEEGYDYTNKEIESFLKAQLAKQGKTLQDFKEGIEKQNISYETQIKRYKEQIAIQTYLEEVSKKEINASEEEARDRYEEYEQQALEAGTEEKLPEFEEIKEQIISDLEEEKRQEYIQSLIEDLREDSNIEYY